MALTLSAVEWTSLIGVTPDLQNNTGDPLRFSMVAEIVVPVSLVLWGARGEHGASPIAKSSRSLEQNMSASAISLLHLESSRLKTSQDAGAQCAPAIRVFCVDDHPALRQGIATIVNHQPDMKLVGAAANAREGIRMFRELQPDVTLMDLRLPDLSGLEALTSIRSEFPEARVLVFTTFGGDVDILRSLRAGAVGYLLKSTPRREFLAAIRNVHLGKKSVPNEIAIHLAEHLSYDPLSQREIEVLRHLADGNRNRDIARILFISEETVKAHVKHLIEKLGANDRTHAFTIGVRRGIIQI